MARAFLGRNGARLAVDLGASDVTRPRKRKYRGDLGRASHESASRPSFGLARFCPNQEMKECSMSVPELQIRLPGSVSNASLRIRPSGSGRAPNLAQVTTYLDDAGVRRLGRVTTFDGRTVDLS